MEGATKSGMLCAETILGKTDELQQYRMPKDEQKDEKEGEKEGEGVAPVVKEEATV